MKEIMSSFGFVNSIRDNYENIDPQIYEKTVIEDDRRYLAHDMAELFSLQLANRKTPLILDLAAGTGLVSEALMQKGMNVVAFDKSGNMLTYLHDKDQGVPAIRADMNKPFPFKECTFDGVTIAGSNRYKKTRGSFLKTFILY